MPPGKNIRRRDFGLIALVGTPLAYAVGFTAGLLRFLSPLPATGVQSRLEVGPVEELRGAPPRRIEFNGRALYVFHDGQRARALDAQCTHAGGNVMWVPETECFKCPIHSAVFSREGTAVSGPTSVPLQEYKVIEGRDGTVLVLNEFE